jgi:dihydroneopterin aldolase/2-amino-4-hydroxy-6-hydroxymethyldihydropteridine diphosphokinase/dihydropteroate synthase/2-amino-4-hydroxy-6-hydroxymethyldihydropteridine diphosphokinase/dihydropteroate synthase
MAAGDRVLVNSLQLDGTLLLSPAPWKPAKTQPAFLDVCLVTDTSKAGATDDLNFSTSYSAIASTLRGFLTSKNFGDQSLNCNELAEAAAGYLLFSFEPRLPDTDVVRVKATLPDALLHGGKVSAGITRTRSDYIPTGETLLASSVNVRNDSLSISDYTISTILGLNDCEREEEQPLIVEIETWPNYDGLQESSSMAWSARALHDVAWKVRPGAR